MPDEFDDVADRLWARMKNEFGECTTKECREARAAAEEVYKKVVSENDTLTSKKVDQLREDLGKIFESLEKAREEEVDSECPNCHYDGEDAPKKIGKCPDGCSKFTAYDKKAGYSHCPVCGDEIEWEDEEEE